MKKLIFGAVLAAVVPLFAAIVDIDTAEELDTKFPATPRADKINYKGETATYTKALPLNTTTTQATTVNVENEDTTLTLSGKVTASNGPFVKAGPGTLVMKSASGTIYGGWNQYGGYKPLGWNEDGNAKQANEGYACNGFVIADGKFVFDAPDSTFDGYNVAFGSELAGKLPRLEVLNGTFKAGNILNMGWGIDYAAHKSEGPLTAYVGPNGTLNFAVLWFNGAGGSLAASLFDVDGGTLESSLKGVNSEYASVTYNIYNGGTFSNSNENHGYNYNDGNYNYWGGGHTLNEYSTMNVTENSLFKATSFAVASGGTLNVTDSDIYLNKTRSDYLLANTQQGNVNLNGVTLQPFSENLVANWFNNANLTVGEKGLTVTAAHAASLDTKPKGTGAITKKGAGVVSMTATDLNVKVDEGTAAFVIPSDGAGTGTITPANGAQVVVAGSKALAGMTLKAGAEVVKVQPPRQTFAELKDTFGFTGSALPRKDGWVTLNHPLTIGGNHVGEPGAIWRKEKVDLTRKSIIDFDYIVYISYPKATNAYNPYGVSFVWQNYSSSLCPTNACDRYSGRDTSWTECHAVCFDAADSSMHELREQNGKLTYDWGDYAKQGVHSVGAHGKMNNPAHGHIEYDPATHEIAFTMSMNGNSWTLLSTNDLVASTATPDNSCYFGISAGGPNGASQARGGHLVANVRVRYADDPVEAETVNVGGKLDVAANETMNLLLSTDETHKDYKVDALNYVAGATVNVGGAVEATLAPTAINGSGKLVKTGAANLCLASALSPIDALEVKQGGVLLGDANDVNDLIAPTTDNWKLHEKANNRKEGGFFEGGFRVGRASTSNGNPDHYAGLITSVNRIPVDRPFSLSYDLRIDSYKVAGTYGFYALCFHNDPRGPETVGADQASGANVNCVKGIENAAAICWGGAAGGGSAGHANKSMFATGNNITVNSSSAVDDWNWKSVYPVIPSAAGTDGIPHATNATVTITYDPTRQLLHLRMGQVKQSHNAETNVNGKTFQKFCYYDRDFHNVNLEQLVGDKKAFLAFGANTAQQWYGMRQAITHLRYKELDVDQLPVEENWVCKKNTAPNALSELVSAGFDVGRWVNGDKQGSGNVNYKTPVKVNANWKITCYMEASVKNTMGPGGRFGLYFHNDERGADVQGADSAAAACEPLFLKNINKCAALVWTGSYNSSPNDKLAVGTGNNINNAVLDFDNKGQSIAPLKWYQKQNAVNAESSDNVGYTAGMDVEITYTAATKNLHVKMAQNTWHISDEPATSSDPFLIPYDVKECDFTLDIPTAVGGDTAYMGFGATSYATGWHACALRVRNFKYEEIGGGSVGPYVTGDLAVSGDATIARADGIANAKVKLADTLTVANGASLGFTGTMTAGSVACDGTFTVDGGVFAVADENTLKDVKKINLANGAKLNIPTGVKVSLKGIYKDGVRLANGVYTSDIVEGGGSVEVAAPGLMILLK